MSDYSGYQIKRAHSLGPFSSVYEATALNGGAGRFALKVFHPPASGNIRRAYALEGWLLSAERQQKAAKKDGAVLDVLAFGRCDEGAYCVMPWQERSLEPALTTLAAKGELLRALAECLLNALEQWGAQTGGTHRKLRPSNIFFTQSGPLAGATVVLSDPWFLYGDKGDDTRVNDLTALGAILAQVVRRREVAAWPIEDGPEWKALGRPGKAWLAYVNYLLDPQPASGGLTIAEARKRLRAIPKDANPARTALIVGTAAVVVMAGGVVGFARFGNPIYMPDNIRKLAETVGNPRTISEIPASWALLCRAWDGWLADLQGNAPRLLRNEKLWSGPDDPLRQALADFAANANNLRPGMVVPEAASEKRLGVLADSPPEAILSELRKQSVQEGVTAAYQQVLRLASRLESWPRWEEMRDLQARLEASGFTRTVAALQPKLPIKPGTLGYKFDMARTLKLFNDVSLDENGTLLLAKSWSEATRLTTDMKASTDRVQMAMPELILARLVDRSSISAFAELLADPLDEMRRRRQLFLGPDVVRERFLKESVLQTETAAVTPDDFPRWEEQITLFSKVPQADDPRLVAALNTFRDTLPNEAADLEADAPAPEPGGLATLSKADFDREFQARASDLTALRARPIVRIDLPEVGRDTTALTDRFALLKQRVDATLVLLKPETWLENVAKAYGAFNETRQRWIAWQQATLTGLTADVLRGAANRNRFRELRRQERQIKEWIDGLQGPDGLGGVPAPDLGTVSSDSGEALFTLEAARREQTATAAAAAAEWRAALPVTPWSGVAATVKAPIEAHRAWVAALPAFGAELDELSVLIGNGFSWTEGVGDVLAKLLVRPGVADLTGKPAEWTAEARLLGRLVASSDRAELTGAAQGATAGLSRKLTAWRRLGVLAGWPANAEDLDIDGDVSSKLRDTVSRDLRDAARKTSLLEELLRETRVRWNRAARNSAGNIAQMSAVFERMGKYNIAEADLEAPALLNLKLWQLKGSDWSEVDLAPLRGRRDAFVAAVRAIAGVRDLPAVKTFVDELDGIALVVDPSRKPTPSPRLAGWTEELTDAGLGLTATWKSGDKALKLDFAIVQPEDSAIAPFYLAKRALSVGEFLDLMAARPREEIEAMIAGLPMWTRGDSLTRPWNMPIGWRPSVDSLGKYSGFELNPDWLYLKDAPVTGMLADADILTRYAPLKPAVEEKPSRRSPLQMIPPDVAKLLAERMLGARLPTPREWQAVMKAFGAEARGSFRGQPFADLWKTLAGYKEGGQPVAWRPNEGIFLPTIAGASGHKKYEDDGRPSAEPDTIQLWFSSVDTGRAPGGFVNLLGNVSIYLYDEAAKQFYVAGGSMLSPPGIDFREPQKITGSGLVGGAGKRVAEGFSDVGVRPAFDAPPGFRERYKFLVLVQKQQFLTW